MMVNLVNLDYTTVMCQLGYALATRLLLNQSRCYCEGIFEVRLILIFKAVDCE